MKEVARKKAAVHLGQCAEELHKVARYLGNCQTDDIDHTRITTAIASIARVIAVVVSLVDIDDQLKQAETEQMLDDAAEGY